MSAGCYPPIGHVVRDCAVALMAAVVAWLAGLIAVVVLQPFTGHEDLLPKPARSLGAGVVELWPIGHRRWHSVSWSRPGQLGIMSLSVGLCELKASGNQRGASCTARSWTHCRCSTARPGFARLGRRCRSGDIPKRLVVTCRPPGRARDDRCVDRSGSVPARGLANLEELLRTGLSRGHDLLITADP